MLTSVIVPAFNRCDLTAVCIDRLRANTTGDYEIVLVDNGSTDNTASLYGAADKVVAHPTNLGFAAGCNTGADRAAGDRLVFLNNDTEVQRGWLPPLVAALDDKRVGAAGARLIYPDGRVQHAGVTVGLEDGVLVARNVRHDQPSGEVQAVTGACLAIRADLFDEVGFDEGYRNGYEDVDLCLELAASGYRIAYVAESVVVHHESASGAARWIAVGDNVARLQRWVPAFR